MDIAENDKSPKRRSRAGRFNDPNYSFGKRAMERRASKFTNAEGQGEEWDPLTKKMRSDVDHSLMEGRRRPKMTPAARRSAESDRTALERNPGGSKLSKGRQAYLSRFAESSQWMASEENDSGPNLGSIERGQGYTRRDKDWQRTGTEVGASRERRPNGDNEGTRPTYARMVNDRLPLSIPYTTPASEFLYGTSVVEAALRSRREPRRKLYKLYVYNGENRDSGDGREAIERLAKKTNVPIIYHTESPRLLDKMSAGRPHNGYILEASPLPKLPLISLGPLNTDGPFITECPSGFTVNLDHQSREEAAVNGTSTFIPLLRSPKGQPLNPFILFLDSILDPGNLGGIIRTASFLGITAIALSTRNSAPLSPIVLKASAGASESVTLFSVNKPAGFITDSKRAGWKVYAAVAPKVPSSAPSSNSPNASYDRRSSTREVGFNSSTNSNTPTQTTSDLLYSNPLASSPCILMLGNEGEGLRWNLRSKADVELSIAGAGGAHRGGARGVDSLNVSVAAGVLCQAFLSAVDVGFRRRDWAVGRTGGSGEGGRRRSVEREEGDQEELERGDERSGRAGGGGETALKEPGDLF
jgi:21S rRNA (GM2251-2'-O)-methyltransferase